MDVHAYGQFTSGTTIGGTISCHHITTTTYAAGSTVSLQCIYLRENI